MSAAGMLEPPYIVIGIFDWFQFLPFRNYSNLAIGTSQRGEYVDRMP